MAYPNPPIFAKYYTERAVARKRCPPPPPIPKKFVIFGEQYDLEEPIMKSLPEMGQVQVFQTSEKMPQIKAELKRLNSSIMTMFVDLMQLITNNTGTKHCHEAFQNLRVLFINMHHLINECRISQGYASLVVMQVERLKQLRELSIDVETTRVHILDLLAEARKCSIQVETPFDLESLQQVQKAAQKPPKSMKEAFDSKLTTANRPVALLKTGDLAELLELRGVLKGSNSSQMPM
uniref:Mediator of RNA polymerase II transcription subunit 7 n=1 Tax=Panagrellus redivivus TaxID=6233 RepID=A0A7E4VJG4_PANRE